MLRCRLGPAPHPPTPSPQASLGRRGAWFLVRRECNHRRQAEGPSRTELQLPSPQACLGRGIEGEGNEPTFTTNTSLRHRERLRHVRRAGCCSAHRVDAGRCSAAGLVRPSPPDPLLPKQAWGEGELGFSWCVSVNVCDGGASMSGSTPAVRSIIVKQSSSLSSKPVAHRVAASLAPSLLGQRGWR